MLGIISDIHGNFPALRAVVNHLHRLGCRNIINLGDTAGYYSMVNECIALIRQESIFSLKGNHDYYLLGEASCPRSQSVADCIKYQSSIIKPNNLRWLSTLQPQLETPMFNAVHGGWNDPIDEYITDFSFVSMHLRYPHSSLFLSGHTHIQKYQENQGIMYCNPGSVGQPRDHDPRAAYAVFTDGKIFCGRVAYDIDEIAENMCRAGFSDYYYKNLYFGGKIGEQL